MRRCIVLFLLATAVSSLASASPIAWMFLKAGFDDGGIATGFFLFDADSPDITDWNLSTSGGDAQFFPFDFDFTPANSTRSFDPSNGQFNFFSIQLFGTGSTRLVLSFVPLIPLTDGGGTVGLDVTHNLSDECFECTTVRFFTSGSSLTTLPEPAALPFLTGLIACCLVILSHLRRQRG